MIEVTDQKHQMWNGALIEVKISYFKAISKNNWYFPSYRFKHNEVTGAWKQMHACFTLVWSQNLHTEQTLTDTIAFKQSGSSREGGKLDFVTT